MNYYELLKEFDSAYADLKSHTLFTQAISNALDFNGLDSDMIDDLSLAEVECERLFWEKLDALPEGPWSDD